KGEHPEFRALSAADPSKLQFNHKLHMTEGMRLQPSSVSFTLAQIGEPARDRYRRPGQQDSNSPVQLTCASCHRLDSDDAGIPAAALAGLPMKALLPERAPGDTMLPITYESHCAACHPLSIERQAPDQARPGQYTVPHRLQPPEVHDFLVGFYTTRF